jgi:hypothetical protein
MAQDELDVRILTTNAVAHQKICGAGGVQQEVGREWRHAGHSRARQVGRVNEHHRRTRIER